MTFVEAWDRQQERYIGARETRFDVLLATVEWHVGRTGVATPTVVDLCCGPAAIGRRLLRRIPGARYVGVDVDPVLLRLADDVASGADPESIRTVECDVTDPAWLDHVPVGNVDVVCSSTALHWLSDEGLVAALTHAHRALRPGGILLDADHLGHDHAPTCTALAEWIARTDEAAADAAGAPTWDEWWSAVRSDTRFTELCERRDSVFPPVPPRAPDDESARTSGRPPLSGFVAAARRAGFAEVDTIWQRFDDRIVLAVKQAEAQR